MARKRVKARISGIATAAGTAVSTADGHPIHKPSPRQGKYVTFQLAEVAVIRALFAAILTGIERLRSPALWPSPG